MLLVTSPHQLAQKTWEYSEEVIHEEYRDPSLVLLKDGRKVQVEFGTSGRITFDELYKWSKGKRLLIAYDAATGAVLVDPVTGRSIAIITTGLEKHPIDMLVGKCLDINTTTRGMVECLQQGNAKWNTELNRVYNLLLASLPDEQQNVLRAAQREWLKYRDAQITSINAVYREGTISFISRAEEIMRLTKEQAQRLQRFKAQ